jgi:hypothetical protein
MELKDAVLILQSHNKWRKGDDVEPMIRPSDLGNAIDIIINHFKETGVLAENIPDTTEETKEEYEKRTGRSQSSGIPLSFFDDKMDGTPSDWGW